MAQRRTGTRGSYAKGIAKREEILGRALDVIASEGYSGASVKELADAVGLSQAGLLHYFDSKEELFTEILRKRDELDVAAFGAGTAEAPAIEDVRDGYLRIVAHNADVPGLVQLYARLSVAAADPGHPAHAFFADRGRALRTVFAGAIARAQAAGTVTDRADP
uniref:TetR/AcrR family transcriptional regulator n=1 Tax=Microbacterium sp. CPCC 204701 TaxID=2493084 RepID=UPI000FDB1F6A